MKYILTLVLASSLIFGAGAFKADNDEKTHIAIGVMSGLAGSLIARKFGANETQAFFAGIGASILGGMIVSGGNINTGYDAIGGALGASSSYVLYRF